MRRGYLADLLLICDGFRLHQNTPVSDLSLKGQKIKVNIPHVRHVNHSMVICIYSVTAISEITALKCGAKYPCITTLKYRPKKIQDYASVK